MLDLLLDALTGWFAGKLPWGCILALIGGALLALVAVAIWLW